MAGCPGGWVSRAYIFAHISMDALSKSIASDDPSTGIADRSAAYIPRLEALARRVYELHRGRVPWDQLPEATRSALIAAYWRARSGYEAGRTEPREVRIE